ncbi:MAG: SRPBCC domain-containing protein [Asticcacaulis sp.]|nr:SRPBCC domain-containing protein [Asticcacaulis sp.]
MTTTEIPTDTRDIVIDDVLPHPADIVWKTLTTPELISRWIMPTEGFEAVAGKAFTFKTTPGGAWDGVIHCRVLEVVPITRLSYAWKGGHPDNVSGYGAPLDTVVTWTLTPVEAGTRITLVHAGFVMPRNEGAHHNMGIGWAKIVKQIGIVAGEGV